MPPLKGEVSRSDGGVLILRFCSKTPPSGFAAHLVLSGPLCPSGISPPRGESPLSGEANFLSLCCENWRTRHTLSLQDCTSPAALSWSSLFGATVLESFCSCTMLFVQPDRAFCSCPMRSQTKRDTAHRVPSPHRTPQNEKMPESLCFRAFESGDPYGN